MAAVLYVSSGSGATFQVAGAQLCSFVTIRDLWIRFNCLKLNQKISALSLQLRLPIWKFSAAGPRLSFCHSIASDTNYRIIRALFNATCLENSESVCNSSPWSNVPEDFFELLFIEFAACSKPSSRDNYRETFYSRTQQRHQGESWTRTMRLGSSYQRCLCSFGAATASVRLV